MADLNAKEPADLDRLTIGTVTLSQTPAGPIWAVMPYPGAVDAASAALRAAHGVPFPEPGRSHRSGAARIVWAGRALAFLFDAVPRSADLATHAGLGDQSDAWTRLRLAGAGCTDVLARLVPVDLSLEAFPEGASRRTGLGHMSALVIRAGPQAFDLLCLRSMAGTMVHELERAMRMCAARAAL